MSENVKAVLVALFLIVCVFWVADRWVEMWETPEPKTPCYEQIVAFSPDGQTEMDLPAGWTAFGGCGDMVLAKRTVCE